VISVHDVRFGWMNASHCAEIVPGGCASSALEGGALVRPEGAGRDRGGLRRSNRGGPYRARRCHRRRPVGAFTKELGRRFQGRCPWLISYGPFGAARYSRGWSNKHDLTAIRQLAELELAGAKVIPVGIEKLRAALPCCRIISDHVAIEPAAAEGTCRGVQIFAASTVTST
jgi:hypothetical protein